jgi:hypothetical protein
MQYSLEAIVFDNNSAIALMPFTAWTRVLSRYSSFASFSSRTTIGNSSQGAGSDP